jgi:glutathionylspermidine synthase
MDKAQEFNYKNWNAIADFIPGRTSIQCSARYRRIRPGLIKGAWDKEEDIKLLALYKKYGKNWAAISKEMPQRTGKQIRDRFLNSLDTKFSRGKFTEEEDQAIIKYFKIYGNSWAKIAKKLKTRTGDMVKNRFYSSLKKTILKNKNFLRRKRLSSSPNIIKNKINEDKNVEAKKK